MMLVEGPESLERAMMTPQVEGMVSQMVDKAAQAVERVAQAVEVVDQMEGRVEREPWIWQLRKRMKKRKKIMQKMHAGKF